jgi:hypothetical protein
VPEEALALIKEKGYPDFMEKGGNRATYVSDRLLGELYHRCLAFSFDHLPPGPRQAVDQDLVCPLADVETYLPEAFAARERYLSMSRRIMSRFGLRSEAELFLQVSAHFLAGQCSLCRALLAGLCSLSHIFY